MAHFFQILILYKINGKFRTSGNVKYFSAESSDTYPQVLKCTINGSSANDFYQLVAQDDALNFGKQINGQWTNLWNAALKSDLSWKAFYDNTIESNTSDNITINLPPVTPHEYLFCLGRDNGGQIYGGHNMVINPNEDHPIIFPIYGERYNDLSHAYWGMVYIFVTTSGIYVNVLSEKNEQLRMRIYYR